MYGRRAPKGELCNKVCTCMYVCMHEFTVAGRKIPLTEIRKRELDRFEKLGIVRGHTNKECGQMSDGQITKGLKVLKEIEKHSGDTPVQRRECLIKFDRRRHLMIWGDGSTILNHGHLLYHGQCVYDPAFYYSSAEMKARGFDDMDVPALVEKPNLYILGRCSAEVIGKPWILTEKNCFGQYLHSLVVHAPIQQHIICSRSTNMDQQECHFSTLSSISMATSSRRLGRNYNPWHHKDASRDEVCGEPTKGFSEGTRVLA